jgi:hypothetical protein
MCTAGRRMLNGRSSSSHPGDSEEQEHLNQLLFSPALAGGHPQVDSQLGISPGCGVGDHAHERAGLEVEAGPRPERAEHRLSGDVDERLHDGVAVHAPVHLPQDLTTDLGRGEDPEDR